MNDFLKELNLEPLSEEAIRTLSPLKLAFLGDAIYDAHIRYYLTMTRDIKVNDLHRVTTTYVKASAQARLFKHFLPILTDAEKSMMMRGRNQKTKTVAKNATISDYRSATGFETLIGFLAISQNQQRLNTLLKLAIDIIENPSLELPLLSPENGDD